MDHQRDYQESCDFIYLFIYLFVYLCIYFCRNSIHLFNANNLVF